MKHPQAPSPDAVIFDFDGVIADTEPLHYRSFCAVAGRDDLACSWEVYVQEFIGFDDRDLFREAYARKGRTLSAAELAEKIQAKAEAFIRLLEDGVEAYDGIPDVIYAMGADRPVALCSGALRSDIDAVLEKLGLSDIFEVRVTADDVTASKPDPACYRMVVERLSTRTGRTLLPENCVAIEDSPTGIQAAKDAGLHVWAVTHTHPREEVAQADRVFTGLREIMSQLVSGTVA